MSLIPITTQVGFQSATQYSQGAIKVVLVYTERMTERQISLIKECQEYLCQNLGIIVTQANELALLSSKLRFFVIPNQKEDLVRKIRSHFEKPIIYLPRAVIEARSYYRVNLPVRNLAISLTMHNCKAFLVKSCDLPSIRNRINEMCGTIVSSFNDNNLNVVITDRADDKYCSRAMKKNIPVVSKIWVDNSYSMANEEEGGKFNFDAMSEVRNYQIKPFHGLYFKLILNDAGAQIKNFIIENGGSVIYGNENSLTHIVGLSDQDNNLSDQSDSSPQKPRLVDVHFLTTCVELGYHLTKREYLDYKMRKQVYIKQEPMTQPMDCVEENMTPQTHEYSKSNQYQSMLPPPSASRPLRPQSDSMNDMILRALSTFETAQTQLASTQMRRLPDPELRIEPSFEPSQQLYWNESGSKRN